jgi:hypothetical protein
MAAYHLAAFPADKWLIKKIDKLRRGFIWSAEEEAKGGKCLVNWKRICAPKRYGGLDIKDISAFSRSLRLRWLWLHWDQSERPWKGMEIPCDSTDIELFSACTRISIGNGATARFWTDRWLSGMAPAMMAPALYKLAFRKKLSVKDALTQGRWMRGIERLTTIQEMEELAVLWELVQNVQLSNSSDTATWTMTANNAYSAKTAYEAQFYGRFILHDLNIVWKAKMEEKVIFFLWLVLQNRLWTADRLSNRGWTHDDKCCLCQQILENVDHLLLRCPFSLEVWSKFSNTHQNIVQAVITAADLNDWWRTLNAGPKADVVKDVTMAGYVAWNIWKERNQRIFQDKRASAISVAGLAKTEVALYRSAHRLF